MAKEPAETCLVRFLPSGICAEVPCGSTVLDAARQASIYITSLCGGDGYCGKCRIVVESGEVDAKPTTLLSRREVQENVVLACETRVLSDLVVNVPAEHTLDTSQILVDADAHRFSELPAAAAGTRFWHDPPVQKFHLELTHPSIEDSLGDHERLYAAIRTKTEAPYMQTGYRVFQQLPALLRSSGWNVTATVAERWGTREVVQVEPGDTSKNNFGVAIDVGTTTVVAHLVDLNSATTVDAEATYNSQMKYGEDYIRRIFYANQHNALGEMQSLIVKDINNLIDTMCTRSKVSLHDVTCAVCAGNTVMIHFLLSLDPTFIRKAPYVPAANSIPPIRAAEVGIRINGRGLLYCLPSVAAYVGSDITAGVVATRLYRSKGLSILIDIGTNGEVVLGNEEWMVCASSSAGPAFEGSGVRNGMRAVAGAIEKFSIDDSLAIRFRTVGGRPPRGICGSGLLDVLAELSRVGILDRAGRFQPDVAPRHMRRDDEGVLFIINPADENRGTPELVLTQADVANLIRSKAAIYAAVNLLIETMNVDIGGIECIYLAGGFGNYLDVSKATFIGMLPDVPPEKIRFVGNSCIAGAKEALLSRSAYDAIAAVADKLTYIDLMTNPKYMDEFVKANFLPHTDVGRFPSVMTRIRGRRPSG
jgi:uncharacterized 2Fe-2S/4Fe-4S cluster protein (DUF4445 family)